MLDARQALGEGGPRSKGEPEKDGREQGDNIASFPLDDHHSTPPHISTASTDPLALASSTGPGDVTTTQTAHAPLSRATSESDSIIFAGSSVRPGRGVPTVEMPYMSARVLREYHDLSETSRPKTKSRVHTNRNTAHSRSSRSSSPAPRPKRAAAMRTAPYWRVNSSPPVEEVESDDFGGYGTQDDDEEEEEEADEHTGSDSDDVALRRSARVSRHDGSKTMPRRKKRAGKRSVSNSMISDGRSFLPPFLPLIAHPSKEFIILSFPQLFFSHHYSPLSPAEPFLFRRRPRTYLPSLNPRSTAVPSARCPLRPALGSHRRR